ncbi:MAG: NADH-quinone oxidoreductase subunit N [Balneolaceae bacterium]
MDYLHDLNTFLPATVTAVAGLIVLVQTAYRAAINSIFGVTTLSLVAALAFAVRDLFGPTGTSFFEMVAFGGTAAFGTFLVMAATLFCVLISRDYLEAIGHQYGEVYAMILFASTGMVGLATSNDLIMLFVGLETMSICLYVLAGLIKEKKTGAEAALKYFLLGAFSTGFLLYGIALIYGATGATGYADISAAADGSLLFLGGAALLLVGFFFKIAAVPFHMWTPDVYQGTPTTLAAYFATASKAATFVAFILVLSRMMPPAGELEWLPVLYVISVLTMILGNLIALVQDNVKRMLAYSSIAHAGYLLVGLAAGTAEGYTGVLYYLFAYTLMNIGAFGVIAYYERNQGLDFSDVNNYAGLGYKQPLMAVLLSVFLFSLAGIPPFVGFLGKYYVFAAAINAGLVSLAVIGVLASAASVYYYLRVMVFLYFREPHKEFTLVRPGSIFKYSLVFLCVLTVYYGVEPVLPAGGLIELLTSYYPDASAASLVLP